MSAVAEIQKTLTHRTAPKIILLLSALVCLFFLTTRVLIDDIYQFAIAGALYEMFTIPALLLLIVIPVISLFQLFQSQGFQKIYAIGSLILVAISILLAFR